MYDITLLDSPRHEDMYVDTNFLFIYNRFLSPLYSFYEFRVLPPAISSSSGYRIDVATGVGSIGSIIISSLRPSRPEIGVSSISNENRRLLRGSHLFSRFLFIKKNIGTAITTKTIKTPNTMPTICPIDRPIIN